MKKLRHLLSLGFFLIPLLSMAQDTLYFNDDGDKALFKSSATYYQTLVKENISSNKLIERQYYMNGQLKQETFLLNLSKKKKEGTQRYWFKSGQLKSSVDYTDNKVNGNVLTYWENGQLKRKDIFENDVFKSGICYNSEGVQTKHTEYFLKAEFPGGENALIQYIKNNMRYPSSAAEKGISGRVVVKFVILKDGSVSRISIKTSVSPELNAQAMSVIQSMPKWTPGVLDGEPIDFWYVIPFIYHLNQ